MIHPSKTPHLSMDSLVTQIDSCFFYHHYIASAMSINDLPLEILQTILELVIPKPSYSIKPYSCLAILCSVCRVWREVALQDPLLWNNLHLPLSEAALQQTKCMLQRSASAPLNIFMVIGYREGLSLEAAGDWVSKFLELIEGHSQRWRRMEVDVPLSVVNLSSVWEGRASMLEHLRITCKDLFGEVDYVVLSPQILPASRYLTHLNIAEFPIRWDVWNCTSITHLELGSFRESWTPGPSRGELRRVLFILASQLRSLWIRAPWQAEPGDDVGHKPIVLQALTNLGTYQWGWQVDEVVLNTTFPNLMHVHMEVPIGRLSTRLAARLTASPPLFQSVEHITINLCGDSQTSTEQLQYAFPRASHVVVAYSMEDTCRLTSYFMSNWSCLNQLDIPEATLPEVREFISRRQHKYPTLMLEIKLRLARGFLYKVDYDWIISQVNHFTIAQVRPERDRFSKSWESWPFEEKYLLS